MDTIDILCLAELAIDEIGNAKNITDNESSTLLHTLKRFYGGIGGNFVTVASIFGVRLTLLASIGQDPDSIDYKTYLKKNGIDTSYLLQTDWSALSKCVIINQTEKSRIFFYPGTSPEKYFAYAKSLIRKIEANVLYVSSADIDLNKLYLKESRAKIKAYAPAHNTHRHTKEDIMTCLENTDILFINDHESQVIEQIISKSLFEIAKEYNISIIVKTLGKDGSEVIINGEPIAIPPCKAKKFLDPSGAGDAFAATFLANYIKNKDPISSAKIASAVSSFIVEEIGCQTGIPTLDKLDHRIKETYDLNLI